MDTTIKEEINEKDIVFVTTTIYTKWLNYQSKIINKLFPHSDHIIINGGGTGVWPGSWFFWINKVKEHGVKYFVHIDEDFFITNKEELLKVIAKLKANDVDIMGVPDGYHIWRQHNPIAFNSFLMIGKSEILHNWNNVNQDCFFKDSFKDNWNYRFKIFKPNSSSFTSNAEPYYRFFWVLKNAGCKFDYLFPYFDERFKSTNPKLEEDSKEIGIHMWYTREWDLEYNVCGTTNKARYELIEQYLKERGY